MSKYNTRTLSEERGYDLQSDPVYLPRGETPFCAVFTLGNREVNNAACQGTLWKGQGVAPLVAASVFGVTSRVPLGPYESTSVAAAS